MDREVIFSDSLPALHSPSYSHAVRASDFVFCTGQIGEEPDGRVSGDAYIQALRALDDLHSALAEAGSSLADSVKLTVFFIDWDRDYPEVRRALDERISDARPARSTVEVRKLAMGALVEIEAIAVVPDRARSPR